jgi:glutamate racemase
VIGVPPTDRLDPIGVFDSGVGGLTVARAILDQLPHESLHYVGDTANGPYGPKPIAEVRRHALTVMDELAGSGVKALVIACNSASAACLRDARERYDIPVIEVILPAVRRAVSATRNGRVGVIGTVATITSGAYEDAFAAATGIEVESAACPRFAEFVERGITSGRQLLGLAESYLAPLNQAGVDTVVLGCTHYPLLTGLLSIVLGDGVTLVSSAEETAKDVYRVLYRADLLRPDGARHRPDLPGPERRRAISQCRTARSRSWPPRRRGCGPGGRMKLTVLGCSGSLPGPDSPAAGYLVESDGYRVVLDLGNGALGALQRYVAPRDIDAVVLSHLHADHCLDMTSLMVALRYGPDRPPARIPVIGPNDTERRITAAWDANTADLRLRELFDFHLPVSGNLGPFEVAFAVMNHPVPTFAVRMSVGGQTSRYLR